MGWIFTDCKSNDGSRSHRKLQMWALGQMNPTLSNCSSFLWNVLLEGLDPLIQQSAKTWYCLDCLVLPLEPPQTFLMLSFLCLERRKCFLLIHCWVKRVIAAVGSSSPWASIYKHTRSLTQHFGYNNMSMGGVQRKSGGIAFSAPSGAYLFARLVTKLLGCFPETPTLSLLHCCAQDCNQPVTKRVGRKWQTLNCRCSCLEKTWRGKGGFRPAQCSRNSVTLGRIPVTKLF